MNTLTTHLELLQTRLKSDTPKYYQKIIKAGVWVGGVGLALTLAGSFIPAFIHTLAGYFIVAGVVSAFIAKTTTSDPQVMKDSEEFLSQAKSV